MPSSSAPTPRDPVADYRRFIQVGSQALPGLLALENSSRAGNDPQRIEEQLALYDTYDPNYMKTRDAMGEGVLSHLQSGYNLPPDLKRQYEQSIRGAQEARGNGYGNAPISAEAIFKGSAAQDYYNRSLAQAGTFLGMPSPAQPDRSSAYTGGISSLGIQGAQLGQTAFGNQLAAYNAQGSPWAAGLGAGASGAAAGYGIGGPWGAAIGGGAGFAAGYFGTASDVRLKENIDYTGDATNDGIPYAEFNYIGHHQRYKGVMAQDVEKVKPEAVSSVAGLKFVDYDAIGAKMTLA